MEEVEAILAGIIIGVSVAVAWTDGTGGGRINSSLYLRAARQRWEHERPDGKVASYYRDMWDFFG